MKTNSTHPSGPKLTGKQIVDKKLREMNEFIANLDLSTLPKPSAAKAKTV